MKTLNLILCMFFSLSALKGNSTNTPTINYVCIDPLAFNYFESLDPNSEAWETTTLNPNHPNYNESWAQNFIIDNSTCIYYGNSNCHDIHFNEGWNLISTYMEVNNEWAEDFFYHCIVNDTYIIAKDNNGQFFIPEWGGGFGWLQINNSNGYYVKLNAADTIIRCGNQIIPETYPITLYEGWNIMSYLRDTSQDATEALLDIVEDIIIVKDSYGMAYIPSWNYNGIGDLESGQGYQIKMNSEQTLIYDENEN